MHRLSPLQHRVLSIAIVAALLLTVTLARSANAQVAPLVVIMPADRAQFIPGAYFDLRVEVHAAERPDDFAVTVNDEEADSFFGHDGVSEHWITDDDDEAVQSMIWRGVTLPEAGDYIVEVIAGGGVSTVTWTAVEPTPAVANNVILFIADGMTIPMISAARLLSQGNSQGKYNGALAMDGFEEIGMAHTASLTSIMPDSASSASAINTGHKAASSALGSYPDTSPDSLDDPRVETFAELAQRVAGKAIGIVTTADWTDATPAAVFAHTRCRCDAEYIAAAPLDEGLLPQVILGGGARWMLPDDEEGGSRTDGRNLMEEYADAGYALATTATELENLYADATPERVLGLFHRDDMSVWLDRHVYTTNLGEYTDQPDLVEMTLAALEVLGTQDDGFYLLVEAGSVDKQMHALDWERSIADLIEFDQAVAAAVAWTAENAPDTLIIVTADHGHGFDVYGTVDVQAFNAGSNEEERRDAILTHGNAGFPTFADADGNGFPDDWNVSRTLAATVNNHPDYTEDFQVSPTPRIPALKSEGGIYTDNPADDPNGIFLSGNLPADSGAEAVHTLQDVPVFATGPGAARFGRVLDDTEIFFGMVAAMGLDPTFPDLIELRLKNYLTLVKMR